MGRSGLEPETPTCNGRLYLERSFKLATLVLMNLSVKVDACHMTIDGQITIFLLKVAVNR